MNTKDMYDRYVEDMLADWGPGSQLSLMWKECNKAYKKLEKSDKWKAYQKVLKETGSPIGIEDREFDVQSSLQFSSLYLNWVIKREKLQQEVSTRFNVIDHEEASAAYKKVLEDTKDHNVAMKEFNKIMENGKVAPPPGHVGNFYRMKSLYELHVMTQKKLGIYSERCEG